jgi:hypothetical protein
MIKYYLTRKSACYKVPLLTRLRQIWYRNNEYITCDYCGKPIVDDMWHKEKHKRLRPAIRPGQDYCKAEKCQEMKTKVNDFLYGGRWA